MPNEVPNQTITMEKLPESFGAIGRPSGQSPQLLVKSETVETTKPGSTQGEKELSIDDFENDTVEHKVEIKKESKPVEKLEKGNVEKRVEDKPAEKVEEKPDEVKFDVALDDKPPVVEGKKRDYSQFRPEDVEVLKRLPNQTFENFKQRLQQFYNLEKTHAEVVKQLEEKAKNGVPQNYYEHPQSYLLDPKFNELSGELNTIDYELNFAREQLVNIKQGRDWSLIEGYKKDGSPVMRSVKAPEDGSVDHRAEIQLSNAISNLYNQRQQMQGQVGQIQASYAQQHQQAVQALRQAEDAFFPAFRDTAKLPEQAQKLLGVVKEKIHPAFKDHPMTNLLAKAYVAQVYKDKELQSLREEIKTLKSIEEDSREAGPNLNKFQGGAASGKTGDKEWSLSDFND